MLIAWPYLADNSIIVRSLIDRSLQGSIGGSNLEMRSKQLGAAFALLLQSPIWGLGSKFLTKIANIHTTQLLGLESIWFSILPKYGILGIIAYLTMAWYQLITIPKKYDSKPLFFISLAYWVTITITSVPGMHTYLYYLVLFYCIKKSNKYKEIVCTRGRNKEISSND